LQYRAGSAAWIVPAATGKLDLRKKITQRQLLSAERSNMSGRAMPFGLPGALVTFTRLMNIVLGGLEYCLVYLDDIIIHTTACEDHIEHLRIVFQRLQKANMKLKLSKCKLLRRSLKWLGHIVSEEGIATDEDKTKYVQEWPQPKDVTEVWSFYGSSNILQKARKRLFQYSSTTSQLNKEECSIRMVQCL
jgi:hypothetical protein